MSTLVTGEAVELSVQPAALAARALSASSTPSPTRWSTSDCSSRRSGRAPPAPVAQRAAPHRGDDDDDGRRLRPPPLLVEVLTRGRSLGKLILGLRIVRDDGGAVRLRHSFVRALLWQFEVIGTGGGIAALSGLVSPQTKRLGDYMAGTIAVSERATPPPPVHTHVAPRASPGLRRPTSPRCRPACAAGSSSSSPSPPGSATSHAGAGDRARDRAQPLRRPGPTRGTLPEQFLATVVARQRVTDRDRAHRRGAQAESFRSGSTGRRTACG